MEQQLVLVEVESIPAGPPPEPVWLLDENTRRIGRRGLDQARAALRRTARPAA